MFKKAKYKYNTVNADEDISHFDVLSSKDISLEDKDDQKGGATEINPKI